MGDNSLNEESSTRDDKNQEEPFKVPVKAVSVLKKNSKGNNSSKNIDQKDLENVDDDGDDDSSLKTVESEKKEKKCKEISYPPGTKYGYKIPPWSQTPGSVESKYTLSEIKGGVVLHKIVLSQPFYLFGRSENNDVVMMNPTVSRHHASLQYGDPSGGNKYAWYLYDMNSSHGTFVNKRHRISDYTKLEDGFMFKLGLSVRFFLFEGAKMKQDDNSDEESRRVPQPSRRGNKTIDDEEDSDDDSSEDEDGEDLHNRNLMNSLKQWFQNEGQDPAFIVEKLDRIFVCKIRLPLKEIYGDESEDFEGTGEGTSKDEATYKAVNKCWEYLESIGVTPAGIKRTRDWKENDYYDSDEDPFFDRTGDLEKKRLKRMKGDKTADSKSKPKTQAEDHASLLSERENLVQYIWFLQGELEKTKGKEDESELDDDVLEYQKTYLTDLAKKKDELSKIDSRLKQLEKLLEESKAK